MKRSLFCVVSVAIFAAGDASAQSNPTPPPTVETYLNGHFIDVVNQCARITRFTRSRQLIPAVPAALRSSIGADFQGGYQALDRRTLTDLYSAIWTTPTTAESAEFGSYRRLTDGLALRFSSADDRVVYGEADSTRHTHNCSTVVSFALQAGARLGEDALAAALRASHDDTTNLSLSLVTGTFRSPIWSVFSDAPGRQPPRSNRFAAYAALWQWYRAVPTRADEVNKYFLLDQFDGLAMYRFTGLSWKTMGGGSVSASGNLAVISASASARGQIDMTGSTTTDNFYVLRFARSVPTFRPLPSVSAIASGLAETADFIQVGEWPTTPITSSAPVRLIHEIALPARLCDSPNWTSNDAVTELSVQSVESSDPTVAEVCRFSALFTPPVIAAADGGAATQYEATLQFPSATNPTSSTARLRDIKFVVGRGESLADYRSRVSLLPLEHSMRRSAGRVLLGEARFRVSTLQGTTVQSFAPASTVYVSCEGEEPRLAVANVDLIQPSSGQLPEAHVRILEAETTQWDQLTMAGGTCRISGQIQAVVAGVANPISVDLGVRNATVAGDPPAVAALDLDSSDRARNLLRLNAVSSQ
jgi:hypothetical protein